MSMSSLQRHVLRAIDCAQEPNLPMGMVIADHVNKKKLVWNKSKAGLWICEEQYQSHNIWGAYGHHIHTLVPQAHILNATVLDFLLRHPEEIPTNWKGWSVFFWGTIYRTRNIESAYDRPLYAVRYLSWSPDDSEWKEDIHLLEDLFDENCMAAVYGLAA